MPLDAHLHLQEINDPQTRETILKDRSQGYSGPFYCNAISPADWPVIENLSQSYESIVPFYGIHPWHADQAGEDWPLRLERYLSRGLSGIGEIGIDRVRENIDFDLQKEVFCRQLALAFKLSKPCALHCVRAWGELLEIFRAGDFTGQLRLMLHSFRGSAEVLRELISFGVYISFSWKGVRYWSEEMVQLICAVPDDRLLIETDFPYTEPGQIGQVIDAQQYFVCLNATYEMVARIRKTEPNDIKRMVLENGKKFLYGTAHR